MHEWYSGGAATVAKNDTIQKAIWRHLEGGDSVAVHCLAGIHRVACIVACHFLYMYRHFALGQRSVPAEPADIYSKMQSVRPHVSRAYEHVLRKYMEFLVRQEGARAV